MKITGARTEPFSAIRKRALVHAGAQATAAQAPAAAARNDYSKTENWLCWPGRADPA